MWLILALPIIGLAVLWIIQFWDVVTCDDMDFPGKNDKLMWGLIVFFGSIPGAISYAVWRFVYERTSKTDDDLRKAIRDTTT